MRNISRRAIIKTIGLTASASLFELSAMSHNLNEGITAKNRLKIVVVGAHPDDPETMCGGTMALFTNTDHEVVSAYLTRGETGIKGLSNDETAKIRTAESINACQILNTRPEFIGQINGSCEITEIRYKEMHQFLKKEDPDVVITHWPIDTHRDHRICSNLVFDAWLHLDHKFNLYYGEVMTGIQSQIFLPTEYVNISSVIKQKHDACYCHKSQNIEDEYPTCHGRMEIFRGMEFSCEFAEAFVKHAQSVKSTII